MRISTLLVAAATLAIVSPASATVTNGSFESGFSGWTQFGNTGFSTTQAGGTAGAKEAIFGPVGSVGGISQNIATTIGQFYTVSFDLMNGGGNPNSALISFGGNTLLSLTNASAFGYTSYSYNVMASATVSALSFGFRHNPDYYRLDNVSVTPTAPAVPEPATWAMMIGGLALGGTQVRPRKTGVAFPWSDDVRKFETPLGMPAGFFSFPSPEERGEAVTPPR